MNVNASGRVDGLVLNGQTIQFSPAFTGGFYIRDNTIDPTTTLPHGVDLSDNLLLCPGFQDGNGQPCLDDWEITRPDIPGSTAITAEEPVTGSGIYVAKVHIDESPPVNEGPHWAVLSQDIAFNGNPTTHDLYYLIFEVSTESGWRPHTHPTGHDTHIHGDHQVIGRIEWFASDPAGYAIGQDHSIHALSVSELNAYETTVYEAPNGLTRYCLRSHRPLLPNPATHARVGLVVKGFLPDDDPDDQVPTPNLELTRLYGHHATIVAKGVRNAEIKANVPPRVQAADG